MSDPSDGTEAARLKALERRIAELRTPPPRKDHSEEHHSQVQLAWRMVIELVAGLLIGFGIGYGLDTLFGTMPIFLVLFIFVGLAAGVKTMLGSAQEAHKKQQARAASEQGDGTGG